MDPLKTEDEVEKLLAFVEKVEMLKVTLEQEDLGEIPDEFLGLSISCACRGDFMLDRYRVNCRCLAIHRHEGSCRFAVIFWTRKIRLAVSL